MKPFGCRVSLGVLGVFETLNPKPTARNVLLPKTATTSHFKRNLPFAMVLHVGCRVSSGFFYSFGDQGLRAASLGFRV